MFRICAERSLPGVASEQVEEACCSHVLVDLFDRFGEHAFCAGHGLAHPVARRRVAMIAGNHLSQLDGEREVAPFGRGAIERHRRFGHGKRVAEMRVVVIGSGMAEAAIRRAAMGQRPVEGASCCLDQRRIA